MQPITKVDRRFFFLVIIILLFSSCGTPSFHSRKYKRGFHYGDKNTELSHQGKMIIEEKRNDTVELAIYLDTIGENYDNFLSLEANTNENIVETYKEEKGAFMHDNLEMENSPDNANVESNVTPYQEKNEKKGKRLILIGALFLLYIPIFGVLTAISISVFDSLAMAIFFLIFLTCFITLVILMGYTKRFVRNTKRNSSRLIILITNLVLGISTLLVLLYHIIANNI